MILKNKQKALLLLITLIQMMMTRSFIINNIVFFYCNSIAPFEMTDPLDILLDGRLPARPFAKEKGDSHLGCDQGDAKLQRLHVTIGDWIRKGKDGGFSCSVCSVLLGWLFNTSV